MMARLLLFFNCCLNWWLQRDSFKMYVQVFLLDKAYHPSDHLKSLCPQHSACSSMISPDICISLGRRAPPGEFSTPKAPSQCDGGPSLYHFSFLIVSSEYHCEPRSIVMAVQPLIILWYRQYFIMVPSKFNQTPVRLSWYTVLMHSDFRKYF